MRSLFRRYGQVILPKVALPSIVRRYLAPFFIVASSLVWISVLIACNLAQQLLPWCITFFCLAAGITLHEVTKRRTEGEKRFAPLYFGEKTTISMMESFACSYCGISFLICAIFLYSHFHPSKIFVDQQVIDIQLSSLTDAENNHEILPSTKERPELRKTLPSEKTMQGDLFSALPIGNSKPIPEQQFVIRQPSQYSNSAASLSNKSSSPSPAVAYMVPKEPAAKLKEKSNDILLEEVKPPEMVELTENSGDNSSALWQPGGNSSGGEGSPSMLLTYLKELHKKIKNAWSPPYGEAHSAEILFRLRKNGQLVSEKLVRSSGDNTSDEAAMHAIASCAPFKALPGDYLPEYLDLQYTFNYKVDELTEASNASSQ
jgi:TonB family protein